MTSSRAWAARLLVDSRLLAPAPARYGFALGIAAIALLAKEALLAIGVDTYYLLIVPTLAVVAVISGFGAGVAATGLLTLASLLALDPFGSLHVADTAAFGRVMLVFVDGLILSALGGGLRRAIIGIERGRRNAVRAWLARRSA